jgi:hypothetical protein
MAEIQVVPWGTREPLQNDPGAPMHDCLWEIAQEQAVLDRMKKGESWDAASRQVSPQEIRKHLDTVCDDNGFRRLDGGGQGRNPNLIHDGERIKVRIDPKQLDQSPKGITDKQAEKGGAYNDAVKSADGKDVDLNKKAALDTWIGKVGGFPTLSEGSKTALIQAYDKTGMNRDNLAKLGSSEAFRSLDEKQQQQLLNNYGNQGKSFATGEVDKIVDRGPSCETNARLKVFGSQGFFNMADPAQKVVLDRYNSDGQFRTALNEIAGQDSYKGRNGIEQAHTLDILGRYAGRKGEGYGEQPKDKRTSVLITLHSEVLSNKNFNLNDYGKSDKPENDQQKQAIDKFADNRASEVGGTQAPEPKATDDRFSGSTD